MTLPTPGEVDELRLVVDALDGKAPEGYVAAPDAARQIINGRATQFARWVLALAEKVESLQGDHSPDGSHEDKEQASS